MENTWVCSCCKKEFSNSESFYDCEEGHMFCNDCQVKLKLMEPAANADFSLTKAECPNCRKGHWFRRGKRNG